MTDQIVLFCYAILIDAQVATVVKQYQWFSASVRWQELFWRHSVVFKSR
jgi:hypothetical protein